MWGGRVQAHERVFATCGVRACVNYHHLEARVRIGVKWFLPRFAALGIAPGPKTGREVAPYGLVTASPVLRDQFVDFLDNAIGCRPTINIRNGGGLYQLTLTGANAAALASLLYEGSTFALSRKRAAATLVLNGERDLRARTAKTVARDRRIIAAYARGRSAYEIATCEAISADTVYFVLDRAGIARRPRERNGARRCRICARDRGRAWAQARRRKLRVHIE